MTSGYALFETPIGTCAIAWSEAGISGFQLPEASPASTARRIRDRHGAEEADPPEEVRTAMADVVALLEGEDRDLLDIHVDLGDAPEFHRRVYEIARKIPPGSTMTYGEIASRLGDPGAARAVGQALGKNPVAVIVPCHRVLAAGGRAGGFSAHTGTRLKLRMLEIERRHSKVPDLFAAS
jgi:methylated-DNA-[protein]-cysteine S-methyltransferase